jgi:hypothetical protein
MEMSILRWNIREWKSEIRCLILAAMKARRLILSAVGLSIATAAAVEAQNPSANKSPAPQQQLQQQQPAPHQKRKVIRAHAHDSPNQFSFDHKPHAKGGAAVSGNTKAMNNARVGYADALRRYRHERHNRNWWKQHYTVIVLVGGGYYYWDAGYWFPAWGYDPTYQYYDYDGPIFTYGNLLPDQVIVNVQRALKQLGYYAGELTGSLGPASRQALANYQQDAGLDVTGAIDAATVEALGLY